MTILVKIQIKMKKTVDRAQNMCYDYDNKIAQQS